MSKVHIRHRAVDYRHMSQTQYEYDHQTGCGYVRENVTYDGDFVTCKLCLKSDAMEHYRQINQAFSDSSGCI